MTTTGERFQQVAHGLASVIDRAPDPDWSRPSPCEGWTALDVVRHLVDWIPAALLSNWGIDPRTIPDVDDDPGGAWDAVHRAVQRGLDDPTIAERVETFGPMGPLTFEQAVDRTCIADVWVHTWDLAHALDVPADLDPAQLEREVAGIDRIPPEVDEAMRASGHFGPRIAVEPDADPVTRVMAFYGRRLDTAPPV